MTTPPSPHGRTELDVLREWIRYNSRVRKGYLAAIQQLSEVDLRKDRGASFPSIMDIFTHILDAYRWWYLFIAERRAAEYTDLDAGGPLTIERLLEEERKVDDVVDRFIAGLTIAGLEETFTVPGGSREPFEIKARDLAWHMVEEELQHRGELNALLWQLDIDPPVVGWDEPTP
jgi:uncharacterized damage-inducible protein DinB